MSKEQQQQLQQFYHLLINNNKPQLFMFGSSTQIKSPNRSFIKTALNFVSTPKHNKSLEQGLSHPKHVEKVQLSHRRVTSMTCTKQNNFIAHNIQNTNIHKARYRPELTPKQKIVPLQSKMYQTNDTLNPNHRQTQKQLFIKKLKHKVLKDASFADNCDSNRENEEAMHSPRHLGFGQSRQRAKSSQSLEGDIASFRNKTTRSRKETETNLQLVKPPSVLSDQDRNHETFRSRSKTFMKDFSKIVEDNLYLHRNSPKLAKNPASKTIQLNDLDSKLKLAQSICQIQHYQQKKISPGHTADNPNPQSPNPQSPNPQDKFIINFGELQSEERSEYEDGSYVEYNTEKYEQEKKQMTDDFLNEWDKMNQTKNQLYQKLRNKLVTQYPSMRKKYTNTQLPPEEEEEDMNSPLKPKKSISNLHNSGLQSSIPLSMHRLKSEPSEVNCLTSTQFRQVTIQRQQQKQQKLLKDIFKQAYFYSKSRGKHFSQKIDKQHPHQDAEQTKYIRNIQKNMTFMSYMNKKQWKKGLNKKKIKGSHLSKNKETILELERQGSKQYSFLKKCLDDAIETCIRDNH